MTRVSATMTQQKQRWLRSYWRFLSGSACNDRRPSVCSYRKRGRRPFSATAVLDNPLYFAANALAVKRSNDFCIARYHSSNSDSTSTKFLNPLHRNPSRISSSVGSIYSPPSYLLGTDNNPVVLPVDDYVVADSIRSCIKIDEDEYNENNTNTDDWKDSHDKGLGTEMSLCFLGTGAGSPANIRSTSCALLKLSGTNYLFDVGEGTQRQLQFARGKGSNIQKNRKDFRHPSARGPRIWVAGIAAELANFLYADGGERPRNNQRKGENEEEC